MLREFIAAQLGTSLQTFMLWIILMLITAGIVRSSRRLGRWWASLELKGRCWATIAAATVSLFVATAWSV